MCSPVCGMGFFIIKDLLLLIVKSRPSSSGSNFLSHLNKMCQVRHFLPSYISSEIRAFTHGAMGRRIDPSVARCSSVVERPRIV